MRLLNTSTGFFEEFIGANIPAYAILSHTWGDEEVYFKDMTTEPTCRSKKGFAKIAMTCRLAKADELQYAWVDTCCIDKSSSAELSEAINSMYQWYKRAEKCYAYLFDLESNPQWRQNLPHCRWFTRGWTLQELIAPAEVYFLDQHWNMVFQKSDEIDILTVITGIDKCVLEGSRSVLSLSVAQRMSWASRRVSTRVEDEAYCLLGIFEANIPLLYGEGQKAFLRLQEETVRIYPDLSIFAWKASDSQAMDNEGPLASSVFAPAVANFAESGSFTAVNAHSTNDFVISNRGVKIHTRLAMQPISGKQGYRYIFPVCETRDGIILGIRLRKCGPSQLVREDPSTLIKQDFSFPALQSRTMYLLARLPPALSAQYLVWDLVLSTRSRTLQIVLPPEFSINNVWPWSRFDVTDQVFFVSDNLDLDYAAAKISGVIDVYIDGNEFNSRIDFMLYSLRWAHNNKSEQPLHTIVPWSPSDSTLKDLNDNLDQYNYVTSMVHDDLVSYRIPISSSAEFRLAASEYSTTVDCSPSLVDDKSLCLVPFWKLELSWRVARTRQVIRSN